MEKGKEMKKKTALFVLSAVLVIAMSGCGKKEESTTIAATEAIVTQATVSDASVSDATIEEPKTEEVSSCSLEDGTYVVDFETDSSMFHVNDSKNGKGLLTVEDGKMIVHIVLTSKNIVNLYYGLAEDAQKEGAKLLEPTPEEVTYADGTSEEVNSFDVPVPYLDREFDVALIGKKGVWYDHKVSVSNPETIGATNQNMTVVACEDGEYTIEVTLEGGSGKATVETPTKIVFSDGMAVATIVWSSDKYDYMIADETKYLPVNTEGNSMFEIPVYAFDYKMTVIADTTAMSTPHEVEYTLYFDSTTLTKVE